jgi:hypothetical protein
MGLFSLRPADRGSNSLPPDSLGFAVINTVSLSAVRAACNATGEHWRADLTIVAGCMPCVTESDRQRSAGTFRTFRQSNPFSTIDNVHSSSTSRSHAPD